MMHDENLQQDQSPEFSILIGLVSSEDRERIFETLDALRNQAGAHSYEVIIADRRQDDIGLRIDAGYPEVQRFGCPQDTSLPQLRTLALDRANGGYIIVTEDHCVPAEDWLAGMARAFIIAPEGTVAVGGCVENGLRDSALDWATFFCEYSNFVAPVDEGSTRILPGMNIAYRHAIFADIDRDRLCNGFWETSVHPLLLEKGLGFYSSNEIRVDHSKKFRIALFTRQRFLYSRYYADQRFPSNRVLTRIMACLATVILPLLLLYRSHRQISNKNRLGGEFRLAVPLLLLFYLVWACGEMVGYVAGAGDALKEIE